MENARIRKKIRDLSLRHSELKELAALRWECDALSGKNQGRSMRFILGWEPSVLSALAAWSRIPAPPEAQKKKDSFSNPPKKPTKRKPPSLITR